MSKVNFRTVEILREIKKTILMRGYNNVDWDVFESWVNDLITEETEAGNEQTAINLQVFKDWCKIAKRKNCSDENRYGATNDFLLIHRAIEERYNSWVDGEWAWEDDGTKPKAPSDPKMKEWMESLGCKFDDDAESIIENALESAMDDGNEYYDDKICQIGELYVSYTSPCDEFPNGCVCVVDEEGRMYGNWCNVSDSGFAVDFLVKTLEKCNGVMVFLR